MSKVIVRIQQFVECCDSEEVNAQVIRDAWLRGDITLEEANKISNEAGIASPLAYWTKVPA